MIIESAQQFTLVYPGPPEGALAFVRDPAWSLSRVRFLSGLRATARELRGDLLVHLPVLGQVDLPFSSVLQLTPVGAALDPQSLEHERAWVEVSGVAQVELVTSVPDTGAPDRGALTPVRFSFQFRAHLATPDGGGPTGGGGVGWGGAAFGKMVRAAATRTLERVAQELPEGIRQAMEAGPRSRAMQTDSD
ncbi:DUF3809 domain-containing protein [Deinococcus koreensis]|uniref:DUF3809 domain-containing protein n=1 Tax=Deinococcus koreensis TaxID=2054903 RepID=A0A2K3V2E4_9DEIO|nr:DUF3809 domain-containing protein [Deinococcus koreensis]